MNQRIQQLAEQCWNKRPEGQLHFDNEKFAELIVKECVAIANRQFSAATGLDDRDCLTAQQMKQHFGVEL
jgi:hypothetical protein